MKVEFEDLKGERRKSDGKKQKGCIVTLVLPLEDWKLYGGFVRVSMLLASWAMMQPPVSRKYVHFLIEEAPNLGRMDFISDHLATHRKLKLRWELVVQNIGQLKAVYPHEWQALLPQFEVRRFLAVRDYDTAAYVAKTLGNTTIETKRKTPDGQKVSTGETARPLLTPDEVMRLPEGLQIAFVGNLRPMKLAKTQYWQQPAFRLPRLRFALNPYYRDEVPPMSALTPVKWVAGRLLKVLAYLLAPDPAVAAAGLAVVAGVAAWALNGGAW